MNNRELGRWGEQIASVYLADNGFVIIERNYRCILGEIDLIAQYQGYLIFIEVKTRRSSEYGLPGEAVDARKQLKYSKLASFYIKHKNISNINCRFDVVEVMVKPKNLFSINHIPNAFDFC